MFIKWIDEWFVTFRYYSKEKCPLLVWRGCLTLTHFFHYHIFFISAHHQQNDFRTNNLTTSPVCPSSLLSGYSHIYLLPSLADRLRAGLTPCLADSGLQSPFFRPVWTISPALNRVKLLTSYIKVRTFFVFHWNKTLWDAWSLCLSIFWLCWLEEI